jgi:hypothetical protein
LYTGTLNWIWKYPRSIDRTSFLCTLTLVEEGGRVSPLSPNVTFFNHLSIIVDIPSNLPTHDTSVSKKRRKKKNDVTLVENNSATLGLSPGIIISLDSQIPVSQYTYRLQ